MQAQQAVGNLDTPLADIIAQQKQQAAANNAQNDQQNQQGNTNQPKPKRLFRRRRRNNQNAQNNQKQNQKSGDNRSQLNFPIVGKKNNAPKNNNKNTNNKAVTGNQKQTNGNRRVIVQMTKEQVLRASSAQRVRKARVSQSLKRAEKRGITAKTEIILNNNNTKTIVVNNRRSVVVAPSQKSSNKITANRQATNGNRKTKTHGGFSVGTFKLM